MEMTYYYGGYYPYFTLPEKISDSEFDKFIKILQQLIDMDKPFVFLVDARGVVKFNSLYCGWGIIKWMKKNKPKIRKNLKGTAIVLNSQVVTDILNWVFERQPPVSPNKTTTNIEEAKEFIEKYVPDELKTIKNKSILIV